MSRKWLKSLKFERVERPGFIVIQATAIIGTPERSEAYGMSAKVASWAATQLRLDYEEAKLRLVVERKLEEMGVVVFVREVGA